MNFVHTSDRVRFQGTDIEALRDTGVLIIDDDQDTCQCLAEILAEWGIKSQTCTEPPSGGDWGKLSCIDVFFVDVYIPKVNGLDLIPIIKEHVPDAKIVIITGLADRETAINALRLGAFDFLERPIQTELLYHAIHRALGVSGSEQNSLLVELKRKQSELLAYKARQEELSVWLLETNQALSVLARNIDQERAEITTDIAFRIMTIVRPAIEETRRNGTISKHASDLELLAHTLEDLTSGFTMDSQFTLSLSPTELRVASLIKHGLTSEEIANQLGVPASTIRTHRKSIRKKLKINSVQYNLKNFLSSQGNDHTIVRLPEMTVERRI